MVGSTVGVSLAFEPRSPQTSSNKSRKNTSASGLVCVDKKYADKTVKVVTEDQIPIKNSSSITVIGLWHYNCIKSLFDLVCVSCFVSDFRLILFHLKLRADRSFNCSHKEHISSLGFHSDSKAAAG